MRSWKLPCNLAMVTAAAGLLGGCLQAKTAAEPSDVTTATDTAAATDTQGIAKEDPIVWSTNAVNKPVNIHQTWQRDPSTSMTLQWTTGATALEGYTPQVLFAPVATAGADGAKLPLDVKNSASGKGEIYYQTLTDIDDTTPRYLTWTVELTGLTPNTEYAYRVGTWGSLKDGKITGADMSDVGTFRTGLAKGAKDKFTVVLCGDSRGGANDIREHADRLAAIPANLWVFNGDFTDFSQQEEWNDWFSAMQPILSKRALMPVQGNHELFPPSYYGQFALPVMPGLPDGYQEHAWSMNYGNVHFVGLDSTQDSTVEDQVQWLEADLTVAKADPDIDFTIAMMHHPAYSASNHGSTDRVQKWWVPVFEKYDVDLIFAGHDHDYERTFPLRKNVKVDKGPVYVVAGAFFADGYSNGTDAWTAISKHGKVGNYVVMEVEGKKVSYTAFSSDGTQTLDTYSIQK